MENIEEKRKMDEFDYNPIKGQTSALKRRKILHDIEKLRDDQWLRRIKTRLNDKRVQFKRKRDAVGYRINPETDDIAKSLVTPSDFKYLDEADSDEYLSKWKSLKTVQQKPYSIKRFKSYS